MSTEDHPVWDVYDEFRTARLNVKYHCARADRVRKTNTWVEGILAVAAPSSAIAGFAVWETYWGAVAWTGLSCIAALLAVIKPAMKLTETLRRHDELVTGWRDLESDFEVLTARIRQAKRYDDAMSERLLELVEKKRKLRAKEFATSTDTALIRKCTDEVGAELPRDAFYIPRGERQ
jgi:hypothetical protein